ncbi:nickel transporter [Lactiplantibacillus plantarum]|nr:nickel transporter [Lactiplantibacillus plantarum]
MKVYLIRHSEPTYQQVTTAGLTGFGRELGGLTDRGIMLAQQCAQQPLFAQVQLILSSPSPCKRHWKSCVLMIFH